MTTLHKLLLVTYLLVTATGYGESETEGLTGKYRARLGTILTDPFGGPPKVTRVDPTINMVFNKEHPAPEVGSYWWSIRWTGSLIAPTAGSYRFRMTADEYARVLIDGRLILNSFDQAPDTVHTSEPVALDPARPSEIIVEFVNLLGDASMKFEWQAPGATDFVEVPGSSFRPTLPSPPLAVNRVRIYPVTGQTKALVGGKISGSNAGPTRGFVSLLEIKEAPEEGKWAEWTIPNTEVYRWIKYEAPPGSWGNIAELEFYHDDQRIKGTGFGTTGSRNNSGRTWENVFDGNTSTYMEGVNADDQYVGLDLGEAIQVAAPAFEPGSGGLTGPGFVKIRTATPDAYIRYSFDGKDPGFETGSLYTGEFPVVKDAAISAVAFKPGMAPSAPVIAQYTLKSEPLKPGLATFHTGNSLTENSVAFLAPVVASMGYKHTVNKYTIPGAPTDWLWDKWGSLPAAPIALEKWGPVQAYIVQPFPGHGRSVANETEFGGNFFDLCRKTSPEAKLWVYMQWPTPGFKEGWAMGTTPDLKPLNLPAPKNWNDGMNNMVHYYEMLCDSFRKKYPGETIRIIPVGLALLNLKKQIDDGKVPGMTDSLAEILTGVHLTAKTEYLAGLVFASCLYGESPVGKSAIPGTGLTEEQTRIFQQIAWDTVKDYPYAAPITPFTH